MEVIGLASEMTKGSEGLCRDEAKGLRQKSLKRRIRKGYLKPRLYRKDSGHWGQKLSECVTAIPQTGMAKNKTIRTTITHSEKFLFLIAHSLLPVQIKRTES
jgi:hypothetical protein